MAATRRPCGGTSCVCCAAARTVAARAEDVKHAVLLARVPGSPTQLWQGRRPLLPQLEELYAGSLRVRGPVIGQTPLCDGLPTGRRRGRRRRARAAVVRCDVVGTRCWRDGGGQVVRCIARSTASSLPSRALRGRRGAVVVGGGSRALASPTQAPGGRRWHAVCRTKRARSPTRRRHGAKTTRSRRGTTPLGRPGHQLTRWSGGRLDTLQLGTSATAVGRLTVVRIQTRNR